LLKQLLRINAEKQCEDHDHDCSESAADRYPADGHTAPILNVCALPFASPTHSFAPPREEHCRREWPELCVSRIVF